MAGPAGATSTPPAPTFHGLPGYDGVQGPANPQETSKINGAVAQIHQDLGGQGFLGHDRNSHMQNAADTLKSLSPAERNAVVSKLSDSDLKSLAGNMDHGGFAGMQGLSSDQKTDLFNSLAGGLSGTQLTRLTNAMSDPGDVQKLGGAISTFATNDVKASYVKQMAPQTTGAQSGAFSAGIGSSTLNASNPSAQAVGQVLASLKGDNANFNKAVGSLSDAQLDSVVQASAGETLSTYSSGEGAAATTNTYDPKTLVGVLNAAASSKDSGVKARVFAAGAREDGTIANSNGIFSPNPTAKESAGQVTNALQGIMASDTNGVVRQLQIHNRNGTELSTFLQGEISQGKGGQAAIGQDMARLQTGNHMHQNPVKWMKSNTGGYYSHAENLGYFSGATQVAVRKQASSASAQASLIGNIFGGVASVAVGPAGPVAGAATRVISQQVVSSVASQVSSGVLKLGDAFSALAYPTDPKTHAPAQGAFEPSYDSASSRVINANP
jgi:hypothetical protein